MSTEPGERNILEAAEQHFLSGRMDQAEALARRILRRSDAPPETVLLLGRILIETGKPQQAVFELERAVKHRPGDVNLRMMLHTAYLGCNQSDKALAVATAAAEAQESDDTLCAVASIHLNEGRIGEAEVWYRRAGKANPQSIKAIMGLARVLSASLRGQEAVDILREALKSDLRSAGVYRLLSFQLQYVSGMDPVETFELQQMAGRLVAREADGFPPRISVSAEPERKLTIGYMSPDFRQHACAHFIEPLLAARDRSVFRVIAYSSVVTKDAVTARLKGQVDAWRDVASMKDPGLANLLAEDKVDIAIDLAGHTGGTRIASLALRPAPITLNYLGYPASTGTPGVDYRIVDWMTDPKGADALASEKLVRIDPCFLCFRPLAESPAVSPAPCESNGFVTFGSFNIIDKISDAALDAWAEILKAVPDSRLVLKTKPLADESVRERARQAFVSRGVEVSRLELLAWAAGLRGHLELYGWIDVALDTFPYNGTTTTCEAMWMGVPVVTFTGPVHASRVGASLVSAVGLPELVGGDVSEYVKIAAALGKDRARLVGLRATMRDRMAASPLRDERGFCQKFEGALRDVWRAWCATRKP